MEIHMVHFPYESESTPDIFAGVIGVLFTSDKDKATAEVSDAG